MWQDLLASVRFNNVKIAAGDIEGFEQFRAAEVGVYDSTLTPPDYELFSQEQFCKFLVRAENPFIASPEWGSLDVTQQDIDDKNKIWFVYAPATGWTKYTETPPKPESTYDIYARTTTDNPVLSEADWLNAQRGANGTAQVERWNNTLSYVADADTLHNDKIWTALSATTPGQEPGLDPVWELKLKGVDQELETELGILKDNLEVTPEIDLAENVAVAIDGKYYYSNFPDIDPSPDYEILEPIILQENTTYRILADVDANNGAARLVWLLRDALTNDSEPFLIDLNGLFVRHYDFNFTPAKDLKLIISRKKGTLSKVIQQEYSERKIYLTPEDINTTGGPLGFEKLDIFNKTDVLFTDSGLTAFSAGPDSIGVISADAITDVVGNRSQLVNVEGKDYLLFSGHVEGFYSLTSFDSAKIFRGTIVPEGDHNNFKVIIPAGVKYVMLSCYTQDQRMRSKLELYSFKEHYSMAQADTRIKELERRIYAITEEKQLIFNTPKCLQLFWDNNMILPYDYGTVTENGSVSVFDGSTFLFRANCKLKVQGNSTVYNDKKGFSIDLLNAAGQKLTVKFGNWVPLDSFHLKAYYSDSTKARDVAACRIWHFMRTGLDYPKDMIYNVPFDSATLQEQDKYNSSALYFTDGIPFVSYYRGQFFSVGVWRIKVSRENYKIDNNNKNHILLDGGWESNLANFVYTKWEVRSPKMAGYLGEGNPVTDPYVLGKINRLSDWLAECVNGTQDFAATAHNYLNVPAWLVFAIWVELIGHADANNNNQLVGTWNGDIWSPFPRDCDASMGTNAILQPNLRITDETWLINTQPLPLIRSQMWAQLKETYAFLRQNNVLTHTNLTKIVTEFAASIPYTANKSDIEKWGWGFSDGGTKLSSVEHITTYLGNRIAWMDTQLL